MGHNVHSRIRSYLSILAGFLLTIFLLACSSAFPSESDGRKVVENIAKNMGVYTVKSFTKTNGVDQGETYLLEFEGEVECQKVNADPPSQGGFTFKGGITIAEYRIYDVTCSKVGETHKLKGQMPFQKTEKGWRGQDKQVY